MFHWKRLAAGLICLLLLLTALPAQAFAAESVPDAAPVESPQERLNAAPAESAPEASTSDPEMPIYHAYGVNSIGGNVNKPLAAKTASDSEVRAALANATVYDSISQAAVYVRRQMVARSQSFSVGFKTPNPNDSLLYNKLLDLAMDHTGNPKEGDYLLFHWSNFSCNYGVGTDYIVINYTLDYYTTAAQESQVNTAVANLLSSLNLAGKDDYQKIKAIYDWMCANISYDYENLEYNPGYKLMYSAYGGLINRTCVCQGYANLFYRLALECGIDARVIAGYGGGPHAWNIVKMGKYYYNLDATWDAGQSSYSYFLKSMGNFPGHVRQQQYTTGSSGRYDFEDYTSASFNSKYPMGSTNYTYDPEDFIPVRITGHPLSKTVTVNTNAQFGVVAEGTRLTYQWQYRFGTGAWTNTTLSGAKTSLLTVPATTARNGCQYRCVVKDPSGYTVYSNAATLTVKVPTLKITGHPGTKTVVAGTNAKFGVIASGAGLTYQWQYRFGSGAWTNTTLSGNKTSLLTVPATMARNGCQYRCIVKDSLGHTVYSNPATLTVKAPVKITGHPLSKSVTVNTNAKFGVIASGAGLTYQWQYRFGSGAWTNTTLSGNKSSLLTVPATMARNGCQYRCVVKDSAGNVAYSNPATLTVKGPVKITGHPLSKSVTVNTNAKFGVIADGAGLTYQWQYRFGKGAWTNTSLTGNKTSLLIVPATWARDGCQYRCVVRDSAGNMVCSNPATLFVY